MNDSYSILIIEDEKYDGTRSETVDQIYIKSGSGR